MSKEQDKNEFAMLAHILEWAKQRSNDMENPCAPWEHFRYMQLIDTIGAILQAKGSYKYYDLPELTEEKQQLALAVREGKHLQLVADNNIFQASFKSPRINEDDK